MTQEARFENPAHRDDLIQALREVPYGESLAEGLESFFNYAEPFELDFVPRDAWTYARGLIHQLGESPDFCRAICPDPWHALMVGCEIGEALGFGGEGT